MKFLHGRISMCIVTCAILATLITYLVVLRPFSTISFYGDSGKYSPGANQVIYIADKLCESLTLTDSSSIGASLYLVHKWPLTSEDTIVDSCRVNDSTCKVAIPSDCDCYIVIIVDYPENSTTGLEEPVDLAWSCRPRMWVFIITGLSLYLGALLICYGIRVWCQKRYRQQNQVEVTAGPDENKRIGCIVVHTPYKGGCHQFL